HDLHLEPKLPLLARQAGHGLPRRPIRAALEPGVSPSALAALGDQQPLADFGQVAELLFGIDVDDHRPDRDRDLKVLATRAGAILAAPRLPIGRAKRPVIAEIGKRIDARGADEIDVRALATVAAIRAAKGHELLPAEADCAAPAVTGLDCNGC